MTPLPPTRSSTRARRSKTSNLFTSDRPLIEAVQREGGGRAAKRLTAFGAVCGSAEAFEQGRLANEFPPRLKPFDSKGRRLDTVEYHPAYHACMEIGIKEGLHCSAWDHLAKPGAKPVTGANVVRSAGTYMAIQMEAGHQCPITMTNAAVPTLLLKWDSPGVDAEDPLAGVRPRPSEPAGAKRGVTIGMGMTEKQGGSDVRANTTRAIPVGARRTGTAARSWWGHKWFLSAPMSDAFLVLAQVEQGLSCFLLPRFAPDGTRNAIRIQRLKDKLGDWSNASTEVELQGALAWMVGEPGRGVATILQMVALTRQDCLIGSAGIMRQALVRAVHHARYRSAFGKRLADQPFMRNVLADLALESEAATALSFQLARSCDGASMPMQRPGAG